MKLLNRFLERTEFKSYEDFKENYKLHIPNNFNYAKDVVDFWEKHEPDKLALLWCDDFNQCKRFTFSDIAKLSRKAAGFFTALGIKKGDRVMLLLRRRWEYWITAIALHRIGAVLIPASVQLTAKDIAYRANTANIKMIVALNDEWVLRQVNEALQKSPSIDYVAVAGEDAENAYGFIKYNQAIEKFDELIEYETIENHEEFIIYFTSGTTGMPKMVMHNQTYPLGHITTARFMQKAKDNGLHLTVSDSGWAKFGWGCLYGQWICGCAVFGYDPIRFDPHNLIHAVKTHSPTSLCVPPTIYRFLLKEGLTYEDFKSIEWFATAGEPLAPEVNKEFERITGKPIHEGFGQSEGTVLTCSFEWFKPRPGSMGKPSPLYDIAIVDEEGKKCEPGKSGEVVIRSLSNGTPPGLMYGYSIDGKIVKNYTDVYHTGDIAWEDDEGYYWYVGRNDDIIKCSGYRIGPFEIESVLNTHPAVRESAITGRPDPIRGQIICATIVLSKGYQGSDDLTKELQTYVKKLTAPYKYPRVIEYVTELPKTVTGKITRVKVREMQAV